MKPLPDTTVHTVQTIRYHQWATRFGPKGPSLGCVQNIKWQAMDV